MSRADWSFLEHLLEEGQEYSTGLGRMWLTVLFLFRMLVLGAAAESAWDDEQRDFVCNTLQPGCTLVCYDKAFPISHFRYFILQVIFVSTPTVFYFGYVAVRAVKDKEKEEEEGGGSKRGDGSNKKVTKDSAEEKEKQEEGGKGRKAEKATPKAPKLKGRMLCAYALSILVKVLLEAGFIVGLWILYNGFIVPAKFVCTRDPCPHMVDCFVSRPTEKTIFIIYTQVIASISVVLNLFELLHLLQLAISHHLEKRYSAKRREYLLQVAVPAGPKTPELQAAVSQSYTAGGHTILPMQSEATHQSNGHLAIEAGGDLLPSYVNCMGAMRTSPSPRVHYKKQVHHTVKNSKGAHKFQSKLNHYVWCSQMLFMTMKALFGFLFFFCFFYLLVVSCTWPLGVRSAGRLSLNKGDMRTTIALWTAMPQRQVDVQPEIYQINEAIQNATFWEHSPRQRQWTLGSEKITVIRCLQIIFNGFWCLMWQWKKTLQWGVWVYMGGNAEEADLRIFLWDLHCNPWSCLKPPLSLLPTALSTLWNVLVSGSSLQLPRG